MDTIVHERFLIITCAEILIIIINSNIEIFQIIEFELETNHL